MSPGASSNELVWTAADEAECVRVGSALSPARARQAMALAWSVESSGTRWRRLAPGAMLRGVTLKDQVDEIHKLRQQVASLEDTIERKIDALVIAALSENADRALAERDVAALLRGAGFDVPPNDPYRRLTRLANDQRIQREGVRYRSIQPGVLTSQLKDTPEKP